MVFNENIKSVTHLIPQLNYVPTCSQSIIYLINNTSSLATGDVPLQVAFPISGLTMIGIRLPK